MSQNSKFSEGDAGDGVGANPGSESNGTGSVNGSDLSSKLLELQGLNEKLKSEYLYLRADFDNYKKHVIKERADLLKYGSERLLVELLGVLDNFERALETKVSPENLETYSKGVSMTAAELRSTLQRHGIQETPCLGVQFDPMTHEALGSEHSSEYANGHISRVFKKPYKLHDKLIRPGQVVVSKGPANEA